MDVKKIKIQLLLLVTLCSCGLNSSNSSTDKKLINPSPESSASLSPLPAQTPKASQVKQVSLNQKNITMAAGKTQEISSLVLMENGDTNSNVDWISSDSTVVSVKNGKINGLRKGNALVKAISLLDPEKYAECNVSVLEPEVSRPAAIEIDSFLEKDEILVSQSIRIKGTVKYSGGNTDSDLTWKSSDEAVLSISEDGIITGKRKGKASVTAYSNKNNAVTNSLIINVLENPAAPKLSSAEPLPAIISIPTDAPIPSPSSAVMTFPVQHLCCDDLSGKILLISDRAGQNQLYTMDANGTTLTRATEIAPEYPRLSFDGKKIVFMGNGAIYIINTDGTALTRVPNTGSGFFPNWSPDSTQILFSRFTGPLIIVNIASAAIRNITTGAYQNADPTVSPDGKKIAFNETGGKSYHLHVMNWDVTGITKLADLEYATFPSWSPDSKRIVFRAAEAENEIINIYVIDADGSNLTKLTDFGADGPSWSPDGRKIAFNSTKDGKNCVYIMNTDGTNVQKFICDDKYNYYINDWK
jgi:hypothetical protein